MTVTEVLQPSRRVGDVPKASPDNDTVRLAIRLGWYMAELRGRYWWESTPPTMTGLPPVPPFALPLRPERTAAAARKQSCETVAALAEQFAVTEQFGAHAGPHTFPERLAAAVASLEANEGRLLMHHAEIAGRPDAAEKNAAWAAMAVLLHDWDACLQDGLAARADVLANAYLLGRGLAECYWALGPEGHSPAAATRLDASSGWAFLFGVPRRKELSRLVGRMGPHINGLTPAAVSGSIEAWGRVADDPAWRTAPTTRAELYEQQRRWYELLVLGRDPTTFVRPYAVLRGWRTTRRAFRALLPQALLAAVSVAAIGAVVVFLVTDAGRMLLTTLLGLAGVIGLTVAAISAALKSAGQRLFVRLRQDVYSDLVAIAITCVPDHPKAGSGMFFGSRTTEGLVRDAVRDRPVTASTPLLHAPPGPE